jgi:hypothetical protein
MVKLLLLGKRENSREEGDVIRSMMVAEYIYPGHDQASTHSNRSLSQDRYLQGGCGEATTALSLSLSV